MARVFVDAHVHFHAQDSAGDVAEHVLRRAETLGGTLALLFADPRGDSGFTRFHEAVSVSEYCLEDTGECESFVLQRAEHPPADGRRPSVTVCRGRQWVSREGVEVLHLLAPHDGSEESLEGECLPLNRLLADLFPRTGVVVLPWGFGKWLGRRGILVRDQAQEALRSGERIFSGDIRARCWPWPSPMQTLPGLRLLPGADPLPISGGFREIGRYVFSAAIDSDDSPAAALRQVLTGDGELRVEGARQSLSAAMVSQLRYRWRSR